jgi:hypothetical protein
MRRTCKQRSVANISVLTYSTLQLIVITCSIPCSFTVWKLTRPLQQSAEMLGAAAPPALQASPARTATAAAATAAGQNPNGFQTPAHIPGEPGTGAQHCAVVCSDATQRRSRGRPAKLDAAHNRPGVVGRLDMTCTSAAAQQEQLTVLHEAGVRLASRRAEVSYDALERVDRKPRGRSSSGRQHGTRASTSTHAVARQALPGIHTQAMGPEITLTRTPFLYTRMGRSRLHGADDGCALLPMMKKVVHEVPIWPLGLPPLVRTLKALAYVATTCMRDPYTWVPPWQSKAWSGAVDSWHAALDGAIGREDLELACCMLFPLHHARPGITFTAKRPPKSVDDYLPACALADVACVYGYAGDVVEDGGSQLHRYLCVDRANSEGEGQHLRVMIGRDAHMCPVYEYAHRLLLWCYVGMPDDDAHVCMHVCDTSLCLNPKHCFWGSKSANKRGSLEAYAGVIAAASSTRGGKAECGLPNDMAWQQC